MIIDYKDLIAWSKSIDFAVRVFALTKSFPADERFGLTNQLRRASVSIVSNIAEGQGRNSDREFIRYLFIANGSRQEAETHLILSGRLGFVSPEDLAPLLGLTAELGRIIQGLIASIRGNSAEST